MELDWFTRDPIQTHDPAIPCSELLCVAEPEPGYRLHGAITVDRDGYWVTVKAVQNIGTNGCRQATLVARDIKEWGAAAKVIEIVMAAYEDPGTVTTWQPARKAA